MEKQYDILVDKLKDVMYEYKQEIGEYIDGKLNDIHNERKGNEYKVK